jgi:hypothetical protein
MSLLPHDTFVNATRQLYADEGSGGGGGGSSLQSPASITPAAVTGACALTLANAAGGGAAFVAVQDTTGNAAAVEITNANGGNSSIVMGTSGGSQVLIIAPSLANEGKLSIEADGTGDAYLVVDTVNNNVTAGNLSALGTVNLNCATVIKDFAGGNNGLGLTPVSATTCLICPTLANGGILSLGSSTSNTAAISVSDLATNISQLGGAPQLLLATGNLAPGNVSQTTFAFPAPVGEGLYSIVGCSTGVTTANSRQAQASCICYVNSTGLIQMGGAAFADVGSIGSTDCLEWAPTNNTSFTGAYTGAQQVNNFAIYAFKLSGVIPGTV